MGGKPRNYALESGVYRFGKGSMYHKKAIYKFTKKVNKKAAPKKAVVFVEKKVGGAKNGETRMVRVKKLTNNVPTVDAPAAGTSKNFFSGHVRTSGLPSPLEPSPSSSPESTKANAS